MGIVLKYVAHDVSRRLRAVTTPAYDQDPALMDDRARFKVAPSIREACDRAPFLRFRIKPMATSSHRLFHIMAMIDRLKRKSCFRGSRCQMASRVGQVRFALPVFSRLLRQTPMITSILFAISQEAAEVMKPVSTIARPPPARGWASAARGPSYRNRYRTSTLHR